MDFRKLLAEFLGTLILVVVAVGVATESFGFKLFGLSYAAGRRGHRARLRARARRPRLRHRPDLGLPRQPRRDDGLHLLRAHEAGRGRRLPRGPVRRGHRRGLPPLLDVHDVAAVPQVHAGPRHRRLRGPVPSPREPGGRVPHRGGAHDDLRPRRALRHAQGGDPGCGRRGHRLRAGDGPPHRHPADGDLGEPGPEPRAGPGASAARRSARSGCSSWPRWLAALVAAVIHSCWPTAPRRSSSEEVVVA